VLSAIGKPAPQMLSITGLPPTSLPPASAIRMPVGMVSEQRVQAVALARRHLGGFLAAHLGFDMVGHVGALHEDAAHAAFRSNMGW
jgi:hypothetical protein